LLQTYGVAAQLLKVEVTESAVMTDPTRALETLSRIRDMGVEVSIDDFGTGHSSLSYLKQLPVAEIKLDRSFVRDMQLNDNDFAIVRSTVELAHQLGLRVVAEGVEDRATWDLLVGMQCDAAQGYYMSPPLPASELATWMSAADDRLAA
jgi:EAL domain-containing protein (putative c-di-GMP-specific phosphodiesterase class I)